MASAGRRALVVAVIAGGLVGSLAGAGAGPATVAYPAGYRTAFVNYGVVDAVSVKRVRVFYVAPEALSAAAPGQALPDGTVLVMEVRDTELDVGGQPVRDVAGRFVAGDRVIGLWVRRRWAGRGRTRDSTPTGRGWPTRNSTGASRVTRRARRRTSPTSCGSMSRRSRSHSGAVAH
jgi:hypothetical protein